MSFDFGEGFDDPINITDPINIILDDPINITDPINIILDDPIDLGDLGDLDLGGGADALDALSPGSIDPD